MTEPTKRDEEVYALLLSNRGRVTDLAAYREELLAASAQSSEPQEAEAQIIKLLCERCFDDGCGESQTCEDCDKVRALLRARLDSKPSREEAQKLIEHCASLAVSYMQDQPSWNGTAADCGYLRNAIVNGDHADFLTALPSRKEEMREALDRKDEALRMAKRRFEASAKMHAQHGMIPPESFDKDMELLDAAPAQGGARDEAQGKQ